MLEGSLALQCFRITGIGSWRLQLYWMIGGSVGLHLLEGDFGFWTRVNASVWFSSQSTVDFI